VPVLVLGGAKSDDPRDALELADEALRAGASGTVFGRNVTKARDPRKMVADICALVHGGMSIDEILGTDVKKRGRLRPVAVNCTGCQMCEIACAHFHLSTFDQDSHRLRIEYKFRPNEPRISKPIVCPLCEKCVEACKEGALTVGSGGYLVLDRSRCNSCGDCVTACPLDLVMLDHQGIPIFCDMCDGNPQCVLWCRPNAIVLTQPKGAEKHVS
jgi:carbon-monoxide dehydrogenase iron sulfur subunit